MSTPLETFREEPAKRTHARYQDSLFTFTAPEYSTAEVLLGSLYRKLVLGVHDKDVDLEDIRNLATAVGARWNRQDVAEWLLLQRGGLASPVRRGQKGSVPYPQLMPLVPQIARYACVLGKKRNRWYPGDLAMQVIGTGVGMTDGNVLLKRLQAAVAVSSGDGIFSRFIAQELDAIQPPGTIPTTSLQAEDVRAFRGTTPSNGRSPAEQCCHDLDLLLPLKEKLTRRQWTVLLEALLRLGLPTHVMWVCHVNVLVWQMVLNAAAGTALPTPVDIEQLVWSSHRTIPFLEIGRDAVPAIKQLIEKYVLARFGINLLLYQLDEAKASWLSAFIGHDPTSAQGTANAIHAFLTHVANNRMSIHATDAGAWLRNEVLQLGDKNLPLLRCASGFTKNLLEFLRHSLGQIETLDAEQRSYDQSYLLVNKTGASRRSRLWPVRPGPTMLVLLAHSAATTVDGIPVSLEDFRSHLANYGLQVPSDELLHGKLTLDLQKLGLLVDSPDAAGGRLLVGPF